MENHVHQMTYRKILQKQIDTNIKLSLDESIRYFIIKWGLSVEQNEGLLPE